MIRHRKSKSLLIISTINLIIGIILILANSIYNYYLNKLDKEKVDYYINRTSLKTNVVSIENMNNNQINTTNIDNTNDTTNIDNNYLAVLGIDKINLLQGFYDIDNPLNNVDKNIELISSSDYPNVENGSVILAAHSGNDRVSYFNKLYKLNINDTLYIIYNGNKYIYNLIEIDEVDKTGSITLKNISNMTSLVLITCSNKNKDKQVVYIAKLKEINKL